MNQPPLRLSFLSDPAAIAPARKSVETFAEAAGFDAPAVYDVGLCVNEAIANVIRHAYNGVTTRPIELAGDVNGNTLTITLRDWGNGRVPDFTHPPDPLKALRPGGLGLPCLKKLLDGLAFEPQPDGMLLRMTKVKR
jgi:anti-sigma regulatory factor (Ser/Thr protein kinase)